MQPEKDSLLKGFTSIFGTSAFGMTSAPGRVNLIGEHTDYNDGFALPCAIDKRTFVVYRPRADKTVNVYSNDFQVKDSFAVSKNISSSPDHWANYARGVCHVLQAKQVSVQGMDIYVQGYVPQGAGLSSSAAYSNALVAAFLTAANIPLNPLDVARISQQTENDFLDCQCGIMDQLVSAVALQDHAMLIDCRSLGFDPIPLPNHHDVIIVNSAVKRNLVDSEYNLRRQTCFSAATKLGLKALRDLDEDTLHQQRANLDDLEFKRALHIVTENTRTLNLAQAFEDNDFTKAYDLMRASHISLRDHFQVTIPETDWLFEQMNAVLAEDGAARMTGGGFGGSLVAICRNDVTKIKIEQLTERFQQHPTLKPEIFICKSDIGLQSELFNQQNAKAIVT